MDATFLPAGNPVLTRELRVVLRNARTFALLAIYVALLGAIVMSQFPGGADLKIDGGITALGRPLFFTFMWAQIVLVLVLVPGLATGALAQERERRTLEPLLLTPMTPLGIVWGKAVGVLAIAGLLLLGTLPLSSLCFLLGGVTPGELVSAYACLLALALLTTGLGLYCAAKWPSTTQATIFCYLQLPVVLGLVVILSGPGALASGLLVMGGGFYWFALWWRGKSETKFARRFGAAWEALLWMIEGIAALTLLALMVRNYEVGIIVVGVAFLASYLCIVAYGIMREAAREVAQQPAPAGPMRERLQDFKDEWQRAVAAPDVTYLPAPTGPYSYSPIAASNDAFTALAHQGEAPLPGVPQKPNFHESAAPESAVPKSPVPARVENTGTQTARDTKATYGVVPFLRDGLNPIFAKDMRTGLLGRGDYFFRFAYVVTILTELLVLFSASSAASSDAMFQALKGWGAAHLMLLLTAGAWFGSRGLAPEREQQTLPQLLTVPLPSSSIIIGKMMAVMTYTLYVFLMVLPLLLLLPMLGELPWGASLTFLGLEIVFGAFAAAWGLFCSIQAVTVRRALGWALGGVLALMLIGPLLSPVMNGLMAGGAQNGDALQRISSVMTTVLPLPALDTGLRAFSPSRWSNGVAPLLPGSATFYTLLLYAAATAVLLVVTAHCFKKYAQSDE